MQQLINKFINDYKEITKCYKYLVLKTKMHQNVGIASEWLIDNYYLVVEYSNTILKNKKTLSKMLKKSSNLYSLLLDIINENEYNINYKLLVREVNSYQRKNDIYFSYQELSLLQPLLYFIYTSKLSTIFINIQKDLEIKEDVKLKFDNIKDKTLLEIFDSYDNLLKSDTYIFEVNSILKEIGMKSYSHFMELTRVLEDNNKSLKNIIQDVYQKNVEYAMLVSNIFLNLKDFLIYDIETIFKQMNLCEKILIGDNIYSKMTSETKEYYRNKITKLSKKRNMKEVELAKKILDEAKEKECHIGNILFKQKKVKTRTSIYLLLITFLSVFLAIFLSFYFIPYKILGFIILIVPCIQLITQIINQIIMTFVKPKPLFKMNYLKGIPSESTSMVVIPTIISDTKKVKEVFDKLETYYLMNKSNNLYFTLLGDCKKENEEVTAYDKEITEYGLSYVKELNKKYKKELFHFVYRKRVWSSDEDAYLGYERKRGALLQFNRLLLKKTTKDFEKKYFNIHTFNDFNEKIKYVITLDTDTEPVLNSLLKLVGSISHPLNKAILNKDNNKVIDGYGMIQPRVNVDIEATSKSLFAQIFAGVGGFDTYSFLVPNFYQDYFYEGNFVGKGIYDLEVFDRVLYNRFRDNLILSHDLLEGNYLRCAYASDIEIIDGFPSKFLVETSRNHRWARGDVQILPFLFNKVENKEGKKEKNPLTLLERYKILDNVIRMFTYPSLLLILILTLTNINNKILFLIFIFLVIAFPILSFLRSKLYVKKDKSTIVYYKDLVYGGRALLLRTLTIFSTIPYYSFLYLDAFTKSIYRMLFSHKNLLNWISSEDASKSISSSLLNYIREFLGQILLSTILFILFIVTNNILGIIISIIFLASPILTYFISKDLEQNIEISKRDKEELETIAYKTWTYFETFLKSEYNYLIPDNYQETREEKIEYRTSPTDIGFSLTSVISAYFLEFIDIDTCINYLREIINVVDSLEKWNGHLYNWYQIKTKEVLYPKFISTVDSGNLVAALFITLEFLKENEQDFLAELTSKLIDEANFKKLYTKKDVLSIGFDIDTNKLSIYNYNKFASESRLTSFIGIVKGDIPSKHWFCLDKSLTTYKKHKGLISWAGGAFEYFMPLLFMKNYKNTLLDETYQFAHICQKDYVEGIDYKLPYGISEAAYSELDQGLSYKYRGFSVPLLTSKDEVVDRIVISPYSSLMEVELYPNAVIKNIEKLKKLNMIFKFGFYDSYDYTARRVVQTCFSHHQGMILMGLTNYLKDGILKDYFHSNIKVKAYEVLLKEKVQVRANIDMKMENYKKYNYEKEKLENDIRYFNYISSMPEVSILSNKKYMLMINDRGSGFSRYRSIKLNRYRKITEQDYGMFLYLKDLDNNNVFSNTYAPMNVKPEKYEVVFASDKIKYYRKDGDLSTKTEIIVLEDHQAEIRKITVYNESHSIKNVELTSYTEPLLTEKMADVSHKVYNQMFLDIEWDPDLLSLIVKRKGKNEEAPNYMIHSMLISNPVNDYTYETDRFTFVGRGHDYHNPIALQQELSNHIGSNIEPILSIRNSVQIEPHKKKVIYLIYGYGRSRKQVEDIILSYNNEKSIKKAFKISNLSSIVTTKRLNITGSDMRLYNTLLNYIYQTTRISVSASRNEILAKNSLNQSNLWRFGISGDLPMIVLNIKDLTNLTFVMEVLKAFEYFKNKSIFIDIVIINSELEEYATTIKKEIDNELYRMYTLNSFYHTKGNVYVIEQKDLNDEELVLFKLVPRLYFEVDSNTSLSEQVLFLQQRNKVNDYKKQEDLESIPLDTKFNLDFYNSYGGFQNDGSEYVIVNKNTETPWSNVIANDRFGTIVTNNGCGYTFFENSLEYKLTSWTNEMVINDKSEVIKINDKVFDPTCCIHGFGYSILKANSKDVNISITEFVAKEDSLKLYLVDIKNNENETKDIELSFYINPTLGNFEEKTARHILTEMNEDKNYLNLRNVYQKEYSDIDVFLSSSEKIISSITDKILIKEIKVKISLEELENKQVVFMLGCSRDPKEIISMIEKYQNIESVNAELRSVKKSFKEKLSKVKIKTKDKSFDFMMNGWYLYQAMSSRISAKAGFYQVSGAYGYRDQLQDAMNLCPIFSKQAKKQILFNAAHQFRKGDVLHWWHEKNHFGLRSRYKDDYLWLVYATILYIETTNDYSILDIEVPFIKGEELLDHEVDRGMIFTYSDEKESLYNHLLLSLSLSMENLGRHNLPLMGGGDWNDGMNKVGIKGRGESVWLGFFLYMIIDSIIPILSKYDENIDINKYQEFNKSLKENLNTFAYENGYYLRAYFDNGDKLGSLDSKECKIDLISQSFAILSGVCKNNDEIIEKVEENLVDHDLKIIKLLDPPFKNSLNNPGYIMDYPEGIRENGGQYTHATIWYIMALIKSKKYDMAYKYYQMINPINRSLTKQDVERYQVEPYVIAADIYSNKDFKARGGWTWYTGSAAWFYKAGLEEILGIKKRGNKLFIEPHLPNRMLDFEVEYKYEDAIYYIHVVEDKTSKLIIDNVEVKNNYITLNNTGTYNVEVFRNGEK